MNIRRAVSTDLPALFRLYAFLNPSDPVHDPASALAAQVWTTILANKALRYFVADLDGKLVSTCTLTLVPNLTRDLRPYGLIENVVTDPACRKQGLATAVLQYALADAWAENCYKVMLLTGSKRESTLQFYEKAGFQRGIKTGFIAYPTQNPRS